MDRRQLFCIGALVDILVPRALVSDATRFGGVPQDDCLLGAAVVVDGTLICLTAPNGGAARMVVPHLVEAHCHLDKSHTIGRLGPVGGDLKHAISRQHADKIHWDENDLRARATRGINEARQNGCGPKRRQACNSRP